MTNFFCCILLLVSILSNFEISYDINKEEKDLKRNVSQSLFIASL